MIFKKSVLTGCRSHKKWMAVAGLSIALGFSDPQFAWSQSEKMTLSYHVFVHGMHVLNVNTSYALGSEQYSIDMHMKTSGFLSWFMKTDMLMKARGRFAGMAAEPETFEMHRETSDKADTKNIIYKNKIPELQSPNPAKELPSAKQRKGALDAMSMLIQLLHQVRATHRCDSSNRIFDGTRHLSIFTARTAGEQKIPSAGPFRWGKTALRCDFSWQVIKSFKDDGNPGELEKPQAGSIWFEQIDNMGLVAIRFELTTATMGQINMLLNKTPKYQP